jgi:lysophospholipase L1-like esterase
MRRWGGFAPATVALLLIGAGCGSSGDEDRTTAQPSSPITTQSAVRVVALGDSDATGIGDEASIGWVGRYGRLLEAKLGSPVAVDNRAAEGKTSGQLRREVADDAELRKTLAQADVILLGIGGADLNAGDDALSAGRCQGRACYAGLLRRFAANIAAIAAETRRLAPSASMQAIALPNVFPGARAEIPPFITADISRYEVTEERSAVCLAMRATGGRCVDVARAFNGPAADADAYATGLLTKNPCCYPSGKGQQLIARLLVATRVSEPSASP